MKIFKIINDSNNMQIVAPTERAKLIDLDFLNFDCNERLKDWGGLDVYVQNPKKPVKNFFSMPSGILVFDKQVLNACESIFEMAGEILPIQVERGPELYILNILECMNGLDYENTQWDYYDDGTKGRILKYAFHEERVKNESTLFKIPETAKTDIFCFSGLKDPKDEFYHIYHDNNFSGLIFEEIQ